MMPCSRATKWTSWCFLGSSQRPSAAAAARYALDFVPLATEHYYLACTKRALRESALQGVMAALRGQEFRAAVARLPGYDASMAGTRETLTAALAWLERK